MNRLDRPDTLKGIRILLIALVLLVPARYVGAQAPDDETCLACHENKDQTLAATAHRLSSEIQHPSIDIACISCHSGGAAHIDNPGPETIGNPANMPGLAVDSVCTQCHDAHMSMDNVGMDPHIGANLSCVSCHKIHDGPASLLLDEGAEFCGQCHTAVVSQFRQRSNHPLTDGNVTCISCHNFTPKNEPVEGHGASANCFQCHPAMGGPFIYPHEAANSFSPQGGGCTECHSPHGSPNERLLNQPDNMLCRQCHGIPPGHLSVHDGIGSRYDCLECHSEVHGSNDNLYLLDPQLGVKIGGSPDACFCHNVRY